MVTRARIQLIRSLSDRAARRESGLFVVEGRKMVSEALASGAAVDAVYAVSQSGAEQLARAAGEGVAELVSAAEMERMSHLKTPPDILAVVRIPSPSEEGVYAGEELTLCLDGVQDPGNLGTIIRTADWFGIRRIVCSPDSADCYNPKAVQATMGAVFRVEVEYTSLCGYLSRAALSGTNIYGAFLEGDDLYSAELSAGGVIMLGSEGRGISPQAAGFVNRKLFIPPYPAGRRGSESLNVAAAAAVVCAEFRRRRLTR